MCNSRIQGNHRIHQEYAPIWQEGLKPKPFHCSIETICDRESLLWVCTDICTVWVPKWAQTQYVRKFSGDFTTFKKVAPVFLQYILKIVQYVWTWINVSKITLSHSKINTHFSLTNHTSFLLVYYFCIIYKFKIWELFILRRNKLVEKITKHIEKNSWPTHLF